MMDLSYNSPAGVCMIANSSRVTWHSAGFCTEAVMVLMSCGRTRSGDRIEREPMAFMEDCQTNTDMVSACRGWHRREGLPCLTPRAAGSPSCRCLFFLSPAAGVDGYMVCLPSRHAAPRHGGHFSPTLDLCGSGRASPTLARDGHVTQTGRMGPGMSIRPESGQPRR